MTPSSYDAIGPFQTLTKVQIQLHFSFKIQYRIQMESQ